MTIKEKDAGAADAQPQKKKARLRTARSRTFLCFDEVFYASAMSAAMILPKSAGGTGREK